MHRAELHYPQGKNTKHNSPYNGQVQELHGRGTNVKKSCD